MVNPSLFVLAVLLLVSGCGVNGASPPRQPEGEYERLHGPDIARARKLYAAGKTTEAAAILRRLAADENWEVRAHAIQAIGDAKDRSLLPEVHTALKDENLEVRESAGRVLHWLGDETSIAPLLDALGDEEPVIRIHAVEVLARIAGASQIETLEEVAQNDEDPSVRAAATEALSPIRPDSDG
jgi:HEAT repeat protein